jgi:hypothetical protein
MVRGYVFGSTYAVNALARVALVGVLSEVLALGDVERLGGDDLVQRVRGAGEDLAGIAMAVDLLEPIVTKEEKKYRHTRGYDSVAPRPTRQ